MEVRLLGDQIGLAVEESSQVGEVRRLAASLATSAELDETRRGALAIVATELAGNIVKHARGNGEVLLRLLRRGGVEVLSLDNGPGIRDVSRALEDGYSTAGSPGTGLGAVRRLSSEFDVYSLPGVVTAVVARVLPERVRRPSSLVTWGVVSLPAPGETVCGDSWAVETSKGRAMATVADGLGHGPLAADASLEAIRIFRAHASETPLEILTRAHEAMRSTRGAAIAVAELDPVNREIRFAGAGNIAASVVTPTSHRNLVSVNGTVGHNVHRPMTFSYPWPARALLVMHSDGLGSRWSLEHHPGLFGHDPALVAGVLHRMHSRRRDDVTVLVIREAARA